MKSGYDKFFKEAQKASGLSRPPTEPKFKLKPEAKPARGVKRRDSTPEDRLRHELARRMANKRAESGRRSRKSFPLLSAAVALVALAVCLVAYEKSDTLDEWLNKIEISAFGRATAADAAPAPAKAADAGKPVEAEKSSAQSSANQEKPAEAKAVGKTTEALNVKQWSAEELSFFSKLNERKKELDLREAELVKLEEELQKRKAELDAKLKQLESVRTEISKTLKTRVANDQEKVDKLVSVYSSMKAAQAAKVIETLNEDLAVEVLDKMKKKSAAEILDMMNAKKARRLSELLTGYQRSIASAEKSAEIGEEAGAAEGKAK